jgi:hypothetical protein
MRTRGGAHHPRWFPASAAAGLLAMLATGTAGQAAAAAMSERPAEPAAPPIARDVGLLPPAIRLFEGRTGSGADPVLSVEGSAAASEAVSTAFVGEMTARQVGLIVIDRDECGAADLSGLDAIAGRLARGDARPFPEAALAVDDPSGSVETIMRQHRLDAVWVVTGIVILYGGSAAASDPATTPTEPPAPGSRLLLRAALIDRTVAVRFSDVIDEGAVPPDRRPPGPAAATDAAQVDLRDPAVARRAVAALLAEYRTEEEKRVAERSVARALNATAAEPRSPHPADFRIGLGVFFLAGVDLWAGFIPENSRWQVGYRYARWTDEFEDPYTGRGLTETTETLQGPQLNYLFRPQKRGSGYLGMSVLQWSKTEAADLNGVSDSADVVAPFIGGGYTRHLGKHGYWNAAMFLAPWAELNTDTGVSSEESSGGFDIQLQIGASF